MSVVLVHKVGFFLYIHLPETILIKTRGMDIDRANFL